MKTLEEGIEFSFMLIGAGFVLGTALFLLSLVADAVLGTGWHLALWHIIVLATT